MGEHLFDVQKVVGSIPASSTILIAKDDTLLSSFFVCYGIICLGDFMNPFDINREYKNENIWGTKCICGSEVFTFVKEHPWIEGEVSHVVKCPNCGEYNKISKEQAACFYESKVYNLFDEVKGRVLELGSGGGFITKYLSNKENVEYICAIDIDDESNEYANRYIHGNIDDIELLNINENFDYVVCRDVLMYLNDLDKVFYEISKISSKLLLLNWYNPNHKNCHNKTNPVEIFELANKYFKDIEIEYPSFYKWGYLIKSK